MLKNTEMSVVAGAGAKELDLSLLYPRLVSAAAEHHTLCDIVVHKCKACNSADNDIFFVNIHDLCH